MEPHYEPTKFNTTYRTAHPTTHTFKVHVKTGPVDSMPSYSRHCSVLGFLPSTVCLARSMLMCVAAVCPCLLLYDGPFFITHFITVLLDISIYFIGYFNQCYYKSARICLLGTFLLGINLGVKMVSDRHA